jgi:hypothetical protein
MCFFLSLIDFFQQILFTFLNCIEPDSAAIKYLEMRRPDLHLPAGGVVAGQLTVHGGRIPVIVLGAAGRVITHLLYNCWMINNCYLVIL